MNIRTIIGSVGSTGPSRRPTRLIGGSASSIIQYDNIEFLTPDGEVILISRVDVEPQVEKLLHEGQRGTFVVIEAGTTSLCAIRTHDGREAFSAFAAHGRDAFRPRYRNRVIAGSLLSASIVGSVVGLPLLIAAQYGWAKAPKAHAKISAALLAAGFTQVRPQAQLPSVAQK